MNHDYAHCLDYTKDCPKDCFRAQLQRDIEERQSVFIGVPLAYSHLGSTVECKLVRENKMNDLIRRQDAIDCVTVGAKPTTIRGRIAELPSAQSEWIPVAERLPEEDKDVIVSVHFDVPGQRPDKGWYVDIASQIDGDWVSYSDEYKVAKSLHKVVAWMPLPKPWKGEENV